MNAPLSNLKNSDYPCAKNQNLPQPGRPGRSSNPESKKEFELLLPRPHPVGARAKDNRIHSNHPINHVTAIDKAMGLA